MNQEVRIIEVELKKKDDKDILDFKIGEGYTVDLNSDNSQNELKNVFSALLGELLNGKIQLELKYLDTYKSGLYIDVCKEYIKQLNKEISSVFEKIPSKNNE